MTISEDGTARLFNASTGACLLELEHPTNVGVNSARVSSNEEVLMTAASDGLVRIWDPCSGLVTTTLQSHGTDPIVSALLSKDGATLLTAGTDCFGGCWDVASGKCLQRFEGHMDQLCSAVWSRDGDVVLTTDFGGSEPGCSPWNDHFEVSKWALVGWAT